MQDTNSTHIIIIFLLTLITVNLFILDLKLFAPTSVKVSDVSTVAPTSSAPVPIVTNDAVCPASCTSLISSIKSSSATVPAAIIKSSSPTAKEYYIPLGSGTTLKSNWEDITATETLIDPSNYPGVKEIYFVASLRNPTQNGQIEAQLYNVTDKNPVWGSQVIMNGPASQTIQSEKIALPAGTKLYRVQLKSSLQFAAYLDNAKVRIITE